MVSSLSMAFKHFIAIDAKSAALKTKNQSQCSGNETVSSLMKPVFINLTIFFLVRESNC